MPHTCKNSLRIIGTHEAVAEVAMHLCQTHFVELVEVASGAERAARLEMGIEEGLRIPFDPDPVGWSIESFGTRELSESDSAPRYYVLALMLDSEWSPSEILLEQLSFQFPDVVVGDVYSESTAPLWGAVAFAGGRKILNAEADDAPGQKAWKERYASASLEQLDGLDRESDAALDAWGLSQLHDVAVAKLDARQAERVAGIAGRLRQHGWPRWSLVAHAANAEGLIGLKGAFLQLETSEQMAAVLVAEYEASAELRVASWVDTSLFGDATPALPLEEDLDMHTGGSYAALSLEGFRDRHLELLTAIGQTASTSAEADPLAHALLDSLSNPDLRLVCKLHPVVFLAASAAAAQADGQLCSAAAGGIELLVSRLAARIPRLADATTLSQSSSDDLRESDPMLRSVLALASMDRACPSQLKPAYAAGIPPQFMLRTLLLPRQSVVPTPTEALTRLAETFGGIQAFPPRLVEEIASMGAELSSTHHALVMAEQMRQRIDTSTPQAQSQQRRVARI